MPGGLVCLLRLRLFYHSPAHPLSGNITARAPCAARGRSGSASLEEFWLPAWWGEISKFFLKFRMNCVRSSAQQLAVGSFSHSSLAAFHSPTLHSWCRACCSPKIPFRDCSVSLSPAIPRERKRGLAISSKTISGQLLKLTSLFRKTQPLEIMNAANSSIAF